MQEDSSRIGIATLLLIVPVDVDAKPKILWDGGSASNDYSRATTWMPR